MQVAVADVSEEADLPVRIVLVEDGLELGTKRLERGHGQRDVVLVGKSGRAQALADALAQAPELGRLRGVLGQGAVEDEAALEQRADPGLERVLVGVLELDQHVAGVGALEGRAHFAVARHAREAAIGEELVGCERKGRPARVAEQAQDRGHVVDRKQQHGLLFGQAGELERGLGDHP